MRDGPRPNVVFMLGDNIGWGALSCYGGRSRRRDWIGWPVRGCGWRTTTPRPSAHPPEPRSSRGGCRCAREPVGCRCPERVATMGCAPGNTPWRSCSATWAIAPRVSVSGMSGSLRIGCRMPRASTSGGVSPTSLPLCQGCECSTRRRVYNLLTTRAFPNRFQEHSQCWWQVLDSNQ
jgi:hypothetical protein